MVYPFQEDGVLVPPFLHYVCRCGIIIIPRQLHRLRVKWVWLGRPRPLTTKMSLLVVAALRGLTRLTAVRRHGCRAEGPLLLTAVRARAPPAAFAARHISQSAAALTTDVGRRKKFPQAVIFDLGGVVAPSPYPIFVKFEEAHGLKGGSVLDTIHQSGNGGAFAKMERGEFTVEEFCEPFAREYAAHTDTELRPEQVLDFVRELAGSFGAVEETVAVIERLREAGIKTAILTNNFRRDDGSTVLPKENVNVDVVRGWGGHLLPNLRIWPEDGQIDTGDSLPHTSYKCTHTHTNTLLLTPANTDCSVGSRGHQEARQGHL